jgi:hypothetical protein
MSLASMRMFPDWNRSPAGQTIAVYFTERNDQTHVYKKYQNCVIMIYFFMLPQNLPPEIVKI